MATPTVWDEDMQCYVFSASISQPNTSATIDANSRVAIASILAAMRKAWLIGRDPVSRTASIVKNSTVNITSPDASFTQDDVGAAISGTGIPADTVIATVTNSTTAVMDKQATAGTTDVGTIAKTDAGAVSAQGPSVWDADRRCYVHAAAITAPTGGTADAELRTAIGEILAALRGARIIAHTVANSPSVYDGTSHCYTWSTYTAPAGGGTVDAPARTTVGSIATVLKAANLLAN